jgi:uncharacterized membrane protein HdeD (DUF308 family)
MSEQLDRLEDLKTIAFVLYCVAVLIAGIPTHSYDSMTSAIVLVLVGVFLSLPGSLLIGAILKLLARLYDVFFPS